MRLPTLMLLCALTVTLHAADSTMLYSKGYWEKEFRLNSKSSITYSMTLRCANLAKTYEKIEKILQSNEGSLISGSGIGKVYEAQGERNSMSLTYKLPPGKAEKTARRLFPLGELISFKQQTSSSEKDPGEELRERVSALKKELTDHANALESMPIATHLLQTKLDKLQTTLATHEEALNSAQISIRLTTAKDQSPLE